MVVAVVVAEDTIIEAVDMVVGGMDVAEMAIDEVAVIMDTEAKVEV